MDPQVVPEGQISRRGGDKNITDVHLRVQISIEAVSSNHNVDCQMHSDQVHATHYRNN